MPDAAARDASAAASKTTDAASYLELRRVNFFYGDKQAIYDVSLGVRKNNVLALIGPSGCGKSTLIKAINRISELMPGTRIEGDILIGGESILGSKVNTIELRQRVGMVFQKPNPFPKSIYENVAYGLRIHGVRDRSTLDGVVEWALRHSALWDEVKDRLKASALDLSGGQQQRLCIARALAVQPDVLLMDEPCSALDPIATAKIEELIQALKEDYTILIVTHNMQQAARVSDHTALMWLGRLIEHNRTEEVFTNPREKITEDYITGRSG
ncbi:MAG TPA: phosphate ABC transporter ATP-binding protein PstB [Candidatus Sumerlaeota bacterium]|nr:phosphate ABC transporter ATP-binding protein PstB [Candidatus Sumerlaeota bacterium]HNM46798.1 phosphate ABC transporter ATP-binding protein PstB [Candidatus Sumerlaeota bacterium]